MTNTAMYTILNKRIYTSDGKVLNMLKDLAYYKECGLKMGFRKYSKQKHSIYLKSVKSRNPGIVKY